MRPVTIRLSCRLRQRDYQPKRSWAGGDGENQDFHLGIQNALALYTQSPPLVTFFHLYFYSSWQIREGLVRNDFSENCPSLLDFAPFAWPPPPLSRAVR